MLRRNMFLKMNEAGEDGSDGGSSGDAGGDNGGGEDLASQLAKLQKDNASLLSKNNELLGETKAAKAAKRELESAASTAAKEKAQKDGDFEQLHKSSELERQKLSDQLTELTGKVSRREVQNAALKLSGELADGTNVELLSDFVSRRLKHTDEGLKVVDSAGNLTVGTIEDLKKEIAGDARYASLLKGNKSSGGGATGNNGTSGGAAKEISRSDFEAKSAADRMKFVKGGGIVTNQL